MKKKSHLTVINNPNYKEEGIDPTSWRKAAEILDKCSSDSMVEDANEELKRIRREYVDGI